MGRPRRPRSDGQGTFGAMFQAEGKPAENVIVKKLLTTAQDFKATFTKKAKILKDIYSTKTLFHSRR